MIILKNKNIINITHSLKYNFKLNNYKYLKNFIMNIKNNLILINNYKIFFPLIDVIF